MANPYNMVWPCEARERENTQFLSYNSTPGVLPRFQRSLLQITMVPWISEMELSKVYTLLNVVGWNGKIRVKLEGSGMEKRYQLRVSWVLSVTHQTPWKFTSVPFTPLLYRTTDVLQTSNAMYMA